MTACPWCHTPLDAALKSCPRCGAPANAQPMTTRSGWVEMPGRADMAKLQFGNSFCQIEGTYVPVADMSLAAGDWVYFPHHVLLWKEEQVAVTAMSMRGAFKRLFAGMPLVMTQAAGPGHIAFSKDTPGELIAVPIQPGFAIDVREHLFLTATGNVTYDWFSTDVWFRSQVGNDTETHYPLGMFMDRFSATGAPGLLLLHAAGNVMVRELAQDQTILVKPTALVFKDPRVRMWLHFEMPNTGFSLWGSRVNRSVWLCLAGPGRVAVQSVFERMHSESAPIVGSSAASQQQW